MLQVKQQAGDVCQNVASRDDRRPSSAGSAGSLFESCAGSRKDRDSADTPRREIRCRCLFFSHPGLQ